MNNLTGALIWHQLDNLPARIDRFNRHYAVLVDKLKDHVARKDIYIAMSPVGYEAVATSFQFNVTKKHVYEDLEALNARLEERGVANAWFGRRQYRGFTSTYKHWKYLLDLKKIGSADENIVRDHIRDNRLRDSLTKDKDGQLRDARRLAVREKLSSARPSPRSAVSADGFNDTTTRASDYTFHVTGTASASASASVAVRANVNGAVSSALSSVRSCSDDGAAKEVPKQLRKLKQHQLDVVKESPREDEADEAEEATFESPANTRVDLELGHEDIPPPAESYGDGTLLSEASGCTNELLDTLFDVPLYHTADWSDEDFHMIATIIGEELDAM